MWEAAAAAEEHVHTLRDDMPLGSAEVEEWEVVSHLILLGYRLMSVPVEHYNNKPVVVEGVADGLTDVGSRAAAGIVGLLEDMLDDLVWKMLIGVAEVAAAEWQWEDIVKEQWKRWVEMRQTMLYLAWLVDAVVACKLDSTAAAAAAAGDERHVVVVRGNVGDIEDSPQEQSWDDDKSLAKLPEVDYDDTKEQVGLVGEDCTVGLQKVVYLEQG